MAKADNRLKAECQSLRHIKRPDPERLGHLPLHAKEVGHSSRRRQNASYKNNREGEARVTCRRQEGRDAKQQQQVDKGGGVDTTGQWHIMAGVGSAWHCDNIAGMTSFLQERERVAFLSSREKSTTTGTRSTRRVYKRCYIEGIAISYRNYFFGGPYVTG